MDEWRTSPLWSIGLAPGVAGGLEAYLRDGRVRDLNETMLWHGGADGQQRPAPWR
jgi:CxxC motif-containing protein (DUF1111 family)